MVVTVTRQFIPYLVMLPGVLPECRCWMSRADPVTCPTLSEAGANLQRGSISPKKMVEIATKMFPGIRFAQGDAQESASRRCELRSGADEFRLAPSSRSPKEHARKRFAFCDRVESFGFTVWATTAQIPAAKIVNDAIEAHADLNVRITGGSIALFVCRQGRMPSNAGTATASTATRWSSETDLVEWHVPTATLLSSKLSVDAGVRTAWTPWHANHPDRLDRDSDEPLKMACGATQRTRFAIPMSAHIVVASNAVTQASSLSGRAGCCPQ
jgi:hypothetical protein